MIKRTLLLTLITLVFSFSFVEANYYFDDDHKFSIKAPSEWKVATDRRGKRIQFKRGDEVTEAYVEVLPLTRETKTAIAVAREQNIAYDGWQYVAGRQLTRGDAKGADDAFSAMYKKAMLQGFLNNSQIIVQEGYFVKYNRVYIVTILTETANWSETKKEILDTWNSFRIH